MSERPASKPKVNKAIAVAQSLAVDAGNGHGDSEPNPQSPPVAEPLEIDGPQGPEPTRFGDWEKNGRCIDF